MFNRIFITGASGCGVSTLGKCLGRAKDATWVDSDDYYWMPTDPPFSVKRPEAQRVLLMREALGAGAWVLSGSLDGWGDRLIMAADLIVFLIVPSEVRIARLKKRESDRFGARILVGGDMFEKHRDFMIWASQYDNSNFSGRTKHRHEKWLDSLGKPVLKLDGQMPVSDIIARVLSVSN
ncbi:MAG: AAA family ATPase [Aestuariivirga sp.]